MTRTIFAGLLAAFIFADIFVVLPGCNTIEGAGKDIQQGGQAIKAEAQEHKN